MPSIYLNDMPLEDLGLVVVDGGPQMGGFTRSRQSTTWPGHEGAIPATRSHSESRIERFVVDTRFPTAAARHACHDALSDLLTGLIERRDIASPDRAQRGVARVFDPLIAASPRFVNLESRITVELEYFTTARWDVQPQTRVLSATPTPIPCGTLPHGGQVLVTGAAAGALSTETRLRYRGVSGVLLDELVLTPALLAGEGLVVDLDHGELAKIDTSGVVTDVYAWKTGGTFPLIAPRDGARALGEWPTLEVTNGVGLYAFRRLWRS